MAGPAGPSGSGSDSSYLPITPNQMATKILGKLYASGTASADSIATFTMPKAGRLTGIQWKLYGQVTGALSENVRYELSLQSSSQFTAAEASNVISTVELVPFVATAGSQPTANLNFGGFDIPIEAGAKIYLHRATGSALGAATVGVCMYFS